MSRTLAAQEDSESGRTLQGHIGEAPWTSSGTGLADEGGVRTVIGREEKRDDTREENADKWRKETGEIR